MIEEIHIAGTGLWYPKDQISNDEIVCSYNAYVDKYNQLNETKINEGEIVPLEHSSTSFIEKASGIKTRHVIDKKNILDIDRMMPAVDHEDESKLSIFCSFINNLIKCWIYIISKLYFSYCCFTH